MKEPVGGDPDLAIETRHLHQVNATPQKPCEQSGGLDAENLRDGGAVSERAECSKAFEPEFHPPAAAHGGCNIDRSGARLADGMLGRWRNLCAGDGFNRGAIAQRPDPAFVASKLECGVDEQFAAFLGAVEAM